MVNKKIGFIAAFIFIFLLLVSGVEASTYYIDYASGNDANNGISISTPWKRAPGMNGFTGTYSHQAGDHFIFKGGVTWPNSVFSMVINYGGNVTNQDYYGVDKTWFTGSSWTRPIFDMQNQKITTSNNVIFLVRDINYVTFDNIEFTGFYWDDYPCNAYSSPLKDTIFWNDYDPLRRGIKISNSYLHNWSHSANAGECFFFLGGNGVTDEFSGNLMDGSGVIGNSGSSGSALYFFNNTIHHAHNGPVGLAVSVHDNLIYDIGRSFSDIYHNTNDYHPNGIEVWLPPAGYPNQYIYNNILYNLDSAVYPMPINPFFGTSGATNAYVYNNIMWNISRGNVFDVDTSCQGQVSATECAQRVNLSSISAWGNTWVMNPSTYGPCVRVVNRLAGALGKLSLINNLCIADNTPIKDKIYNFDSGQIVNNFIETNNLVMSISNATLQGYNAANKYHSGSSNLPSIDSGISILSECTNCSNLNKDILGVSRPQGSAWDIGAYEYAAPTTCANCHYVRQSAIGNGNGSDWNNAYTTLPMVLIRNHTYYVADGNYSGYTFDDAASGVQYITIKKATIDEHGVDAGWQDTFGDGKAIFTGILTFATNNYIFDGVNGSFKNGHGFELLCNWQGTGINVNADNINVSHLKIYWSTNSSDPNFLNPVSSTGIDVRKPSFSPVYNLTLHNLYFTKIPGRPFFLIATRSFLFENSVIDDMYASAEPCCHASGMSIVVAQSEDGTIRYNLFENILGTAGIGFYDANHYRWKIYGNVFKGGNVGVTIIGSNAGETKGPVYDSVVYGNTFVNLGNGGIRFDGNNISVENNLWFNSPNIVHGIPSNSVYDYNYYSNTSGWMSGWSLGLHDTPYRKDLSDNWYSLLNESPFVNANNADYHLKSPTTQGINLDTTYNKDFDGNVRGADGLWDIGAYEYNSGAVQNNHHPADINGDNNISSLELNNYISSYLSGSYNLRNALYLITLKQKGGRYNYNSSSNCDIIPWNCYI